jgi:hypothetical protein
MGEWAKRRSQGRNAVDDYSPFRVRNLGPSSQAKILAVLGRLKLPFADSPFRPFAVSPFRLKGRVANSSTP